MILDTCRAQEVADEVLATLDNSYPPEELIPGLVQAIKELAGTVCGADGFVAREDQILEEAADMLADAAV